MEFDLRKVNGSELAKPAKLNGYLNDILHKEISIWGNSFGAKEKESFYNELSILLNAGITVRECLLLIKNTLRKNKHSTVIEEIVTQITSGQSFSDALFSTGHFSRYDYYSLKIGEETGTIARICEDLALFYARKNEQRRILIGALTYPLIIVLTAVTVVIFMLNYVVPMFEDIFKQNNLELPVLTQLIVKISRSLKTGGIWILLAVLLLSLFFQIQLKNSRFKSVVHQVILHVPIIGPFIRKFYLAQFLQAVALLTSAKIPLLNIVQMAKEMMMFIPFQKSLGKVESDILQGRNLSESLADDKLFDARIVALVKVSEETNQTSFIFQQLSDQYNADLRQQSKLLTTILEPIIILFVGVIVAILLIALYLPMFQLSNAIQ